jgi:hypothetical protein
MQYIHPYVSAFLDRAEVVQEQQGLRAASTERRTPRQGETPPLVSPRDGRLSSGALGNLSRPAAAASEATGDIQSREGPRNGDADAANGATPGSPLVNTCEEAMQGSEAGGAVDSDEGIEDEQVMATATMSVRRGRSGQGTLPCCFVLLCPLAPHCCSIACSECGRGDIVLLSHTQVWFFGLPLFRS